MDIRPPLIPPGSPMQAGLPGWPAGTRPERRLHLALPLIRALVGALVRLLLLALALLPCAATRAAAPDVFAADRLTLEADNPADLWIARGEALWHQPAGPRQRPLSDCDLGLGPGVTEGAYARLPRWFDDAGAVLDLEQRLLWCRVHLQGLGSAEASKDPFGEGRRVSAQEALTAFIANASRGRPVAVQAEHPEEQRLLALGRRLFWYRAGPHDFACATCHAQEGARIRLQGLPNLRNPADVRSSFTTWPAYRLSQGEVRTLEHRLVDCFRQQRFPEAQYGSEAITALTLMLAVDARGGVFAAPGIKR